VYVIIALRLVMFAEMPESHGARRTAGQDALATARPDILDRNGGILAARIAPRRRINQMHRCEKNILELNRANRCIREHS
jgi:hypothetical protein